MLNLNDDRITHVLINVWFQSFSGWPETVTSCRVWVAPSRDESGAESLNQREVDWKGIPESSPLSAALISLSELGIPVVEGHSDSFRRRHVITREEYEAILGEAGGV